MKKKLIFGFAVILLLMVGVVANAEIKRQTAVPQYTQESIEDSIDLATPDKLYVEISNIRREYNLPQMIYSNELNASAGDKCSDMVANNYYGHENPFTGKKGYSYIEHTMKGAVYVSENLNQGNEDTAKAYVDSWMNSASHRSAILDSRYTHTGFAVCQRGDKFTIVQHMAQVEIPEATQAPTYRSPLVPQTTCHTKHYSFDGSFVTSC